MSRSLVLALVLISVSSAKDSLEDPDHANHFSSAPVQAGDITATAAAAWARQQEAKLKVKLNNRSDDFVLVGKNGARISMASGEFTAINSDGFKLIAPQSEGGHTFVFTDDGGKLHSERMVARLEGVKTASTSASPVEAEAFTLPLHKTEIEASGFTCVNKGKIKQETQETKAKFECTFNGEAGTVGLVTSKAITFAIPDGSDYANESGEPMELLFPGDKVSFEVKNTIIKPNPHGVDMQHTELTLLWNDALRVATLEPVPFPDWEFALDAALTAEKNK
jgi:hypothetical protein